MAKQILRYFLHNPHAADTLEGIARWRLLDEQIRQSVRMTTLAVQSLVSMGLLVAERAGAAGIVYRLNEAKRGEALRFCAERPRRNMARAGPKRTRT